MKSLVKMVIGLLIALAGFYWYYEVPAYFQALETVFYGSFGVILILFGLLVAWIEWEDYKWEKEEKKVPKKRTAKKRTTKRKKK
jgi:hypothetical protein